MPPFLYKSIYIYSKPKGAENSKENLCPDLLNFEVLLFQPAVTKQIRTGLLKEGSIWRKNSCKVGSYKLFYRYKIFRISIILGEKFRSQKEN